jgi:tetratricopeptide (TPR) repeat protein
MLLKRQAALFGALLLTAALSPLAPAQEVPGCGNLHNAYGPFDYANPVARRDSLPIVEQYHFTPDVESLHSGSSGTIIGDLDYTLRAFPNHIRALSALARYGLQGGSMGTNHITSVECYFRRAIAFREKDPAVRIVYGSYLQRKGEIKQAEEQFEQAVALAPDSVEVAYNAGLFFLRVGNVDRAYQLALVAYKGGYPLPGLRNQLASRGRTLDIPASP